MNTLMVFASVYHPHSRIFLFSFIHDFGFAILGITCHLEAVHVQRSKESDELTVGYSPVHRKSR